jgi:L-fuconolactonase
MRVDAHQHFWRINRRGNAWPPPKMTALYRDFMPADLAPLLQRHRIDATVLVQSLPMLDDTRFMLDLAARHAFIRGVVGWVDLEMADVSALIGNLARDPLFKGVRPMLQDMADDEWILNAALAPAIGALQEHSLSLDALVLPRHLPSLLAFARRFPALPICIDHAAKPPVARAALAPWMDDIARLAALPQVVCKLSGLVTEAALHWQAAELAPYARHVLDCFGARRVLWGSDWPVLNLASDYGHWLETSEILLAHLDENERAQVMGLNAQRFYRIAEH